jgi:hypothetical protein
MKQRGRSEYTNDNADSSLLSEEPWADQDSVLELVGLGKIAGY